MAADLGVVITGDAPRVTLVVAGRRVTLLVAGRRVTLVVVSAVNIQLDPNAGCDPVAV